MSKFSLNKMKEGTIKFWKWGLTRVCKICYFSQLFLIIFSIKQEGFKFSLYLSVPLLCGFIYANPKVMNDLSK